MVSRHRWALRIYVSARMVPKKAFVTHMQRPRTSQRVHALQWALPDVVRESANPWEKDCTQASRMRALTEQRWAWKHSGLCCGMALPLLWISRHGLVLVLGHISAAMLTLHVNAYCLSDPKYRRLETCQRPLSSSQLKIQSIQTWTCCAGHRRMSVRGEQRAPAAHLNWALNPIGP